MALTGLQIQKLLPKTNCKECGSNTCLAFAMKLAAKKADLSQCPYASDEAKQVLGAAAEPPVKGVALGDKRQSNSARKPSSTATKRPLSTRPPSPQYQRHRRPAAIDADAHRYQGLRA